MYLILIIALFIFIALFILLKSKKFKYGSFVVITGSVKTGKTQLSLHLAFKEFKKRLFKYKICKCILKKADLECPLFYSNIPLNLKKYNSYLCIINNDLLKRQMRFNYKSVVFLDEISLVADSMNGLGRSESDILTSSRLTLFCKLSAHMTRGGIIFCNTQNQSDLHYSFKKCMNNYLYIHSQFKIPFFCILRVQEFAYSYDNNLINNNSSDLEDNLKWLIVPKSIWKKYDRYCYSVLTDNKRIKNDIYVQKNNLKTNFVASVDKSLLERAKEGIYEEKK